MATFKSFDGVVIAFDDIGEGQPVILLHGLLSQAKHMASIAEGIKDAGRRCISMDLRAHGRSEGPHDPAAYRDQAMARDVIALAEHIELSEYALAGYGLGAEIVSRVINLGAPVTRAVMCGWGGSPTNQLDLYASDDWAAQTIRLAEGFEVDDPETIADPMAKAWRQAADNQGLDRLAFAARQRSGDSAEPGLDPRNIKTPVLVICGEEDSDPHVYAASLPNAQGFVVKGGHGTAGRDPVLAEKMAEFLSK